MRTVATLLTLFWINPLLIKLNRKSPLDRALEFILVELVEKRDYLATDKEIAQDTESGGNSKHYL